MTLLSISVTSLWEFTYDFTTSFPHSYTLTILLLLWLDYTCFYLANSQLIANHICVTGQIPFHLFKDITLGNVPPPLPPISESFLQIRYIVHYEKGQKNDPNFPYSCCHSPLHENFLKKLSIIIVSIFSPLIFPGNHSSQDYFSYFCNCFCQGHQWLQIQGSILRPHWWHIFSIAFFSSWFLGHHLLSSSWLTDGCRSVSLTGIFLSLTSRC